MLMETLGNCGGPAKGPLAIMVGEPADSCPQAAVLQDPDIGKWFRVVHGPGRPGQLEGVPRATLPHFWRDLLATADMWLAAYNANSGAQP